MSRHAETILAAIETAKATSALTSSWRRCASLYRLSPDILSPLEPDRPALRDALDREAPLVAIAAPYLDKLHGVIERPDATVWLADRHGMVLDQRTGLSHDIWLRKPARWVGMRFQERDCGTSGIGTCLAEERPVMVAGAQHFFDRLVPVTGFGTPIFGSDGSLAGCLSCSYRTSARDRDLLVLSIVGSFARRIEIALFATAFPRSQLLLAARDGTEPCALLAVDADDRVVGATRAARRLLDLSDPRLAEGFSSRDLFDLPDELAGAEARHIVQAMARHRNNRSAVAKALGISRSTLYRKLAVLPRRRSQSGDV